jgi:hypothetical protein
MVEPFTDDLESDSMLAPLDIAPRFAQSVSTEVAAQVYRLRPALD